MFYDTKATILDENHIALIETYLDIQPYEKTMQFEDDIEIEITARVFCDKTSEFTKAGYFQCDNKIYKIMKIKEWSNYLECFLYQCERE